MISVRRELLGSLPSSPLLSSANGSVLGKLQQRSAGVAIAFDLSFGKYQGEGSGFPIA